MARHSNIPRLTNTSHNVFQVYFPSLLTPLPIRGNYSRSQHRQSGQNPFFPLHAACAAGDAARVQCLLDLGNDINLKNYCGQTPLEVAVMHGHIQIVSTLLHFRKRCEQDIDIATAVEIAKEQNLWDIFELLLHDKHGADMNAMLKNWETSDEAHTKQENQLKEYIRMLEMCFYIQRQQIRNMRKHLRTVGMDERISTTLKPNTKFIRNKVSWNFQHELHASRIQQELAQKDAELKYWKNVAQNRHSEEVSEQMDIDRFQKAEANTFQMSRKIFSDMSEWAKEVQCGLDLVHHFMNSDKMKVQQCLDDVISEIEIQSTKY